MASFRKRGRNWYYAYVTADGTRRERKGCPDKRETERIARAAEIEAAKIRAGLIDPRDVARKAHATQPLSDHIQAFRHHLESRGATAKHVTTTAKRIRRLAALASGATHQDMSPVKSMTRADLDRFEAALDDLMRRLRLGDLTTDKIQAALRSLIDDGLSLSSANHHAAAVRMFSKWLWDSGRWDGHNLRAVRGYNAKSDRRHDRRTLSLDELRRLIEAAHNGPLWRRMTGPARALVYRLAVATGLRHDEIRSIIPASFDWLADPPTVTVEAGYTKNGQTATQPLPNDLVDDLRPFVEAASPGDPVFWLVEHRGAMMLRGDLKAAGIPYRDDAGLVFDFHALRCQLATLADAAGASPRAIQRLMRHSTLELTGRYTRPRATELNQAALAVPSLRPAGIA